MQSLTIPQSIRAFLVICLTFSVQTSSIEAQEAFDLKVEFPTTQQVRVTSNYEHYGAVLILQDPERTDESIKPLKLDVEAKISYRQRMMNQEQAIRFFDFARATIKLDEGKTKPVLTDANKLIIARSKAGSTKQVEMASIKDTLQQSELELIQNPSDPLTLAALLTKARVKQGDKWKADKHALAKFLAVNSINESTVKLTLKKVDKNSARVFIAGSVSANVDDATTQMDISGIANVDRKTNMLSSFKIGIRETKKPGQIAPGFEGNTKIDLRFAKTKDAKELSNQSLTNYTKYGKIRQRLKWVSALGQCQLIYEPRWKMITEEQEAAVLRFIDGKKLLAQCNVVLLPDRLSPQPLTLEEYQKEVSKIVESDPSAKLEKSGQARTKNGNQSLMVVVSGVEEGVPVEWIYYNVAAKDGRQVAIVFTLEKAVDYRVSQVAKQLVDEFEFIELKQPVASAKKDNNKSNVYRKNR